MSIPSKDECLHLLYSVNMPDHIQSHSLLVCRVAVVLTDGLVASGVDVDRGLVRASALLHDITKPRSFKTGENHAQTGGLYMADMGWPEVGEIVRQHVTLDHYFAADEPNEAEVVNYADKRVLHDKVVPLDERMTYILHRYAKTEKHQALLKTLWDQTRLLEKRLFAHLAFTPENLDQHLGQTSG